MRHWLLTLSISIFSWNAGAQPAYDEIYLKTYAHCSKTLNASGSVDIAKWIWRLYQPRTVREGLLQVVTTSSSEDIAIALQTRGLTPRVAVYLNSPSFYQALDQCYGQSDFLKKTYISGLVLSDLSGKVAGIGIAAGTTVAMGRLLAPVLAPIFRRYPSAKRFMVAGSASLAAVLAYNDYLHMNREATPEEKAEMEKLIAAPIQRGNELVQSVQGLLVTEIESLQERLPLAAEEERSAMKARIETLQAHLVTLRNLDEVKPVEEKR